MTHQTRRFPIGAEVTDSGVSFRVWAPAHPQCFVVVNETDCREMIPEAGGYFTIEWPGIVAGASYQFYFGDSIDRLADPASRFQPDGPAGRSIVIDPNAFAWDDQDWGGMGPRGVVLYEMHVGTFTREGTFAAAKSKLRQLREIGITCIEVMPINEFEGTFGWGYDGTLLYAPTRLYGEPDEVRSFVNEAHRVGLGVILDVVYNHFGHGNRFEKFTPDYFTDRYRNEWGRSINFDGPNAHGVREHVAKNAAYWIDEFHFDGLRIDATQAVFDASSEHIVTQLAREARAAARHRQVYIISENEPQQARMVRPVARGGNGLDALWNDDFHHSAMVALTSRNDAYYHDHRGLSQEFVSSAKYGYLFQGQRYDWQDGARGSPALDLKPWNFIHFIQNHDQIANSGTGARAGACSSPARLRAMTALLLLGPQTPMLFQGQEFGASTPFHYFADRTGPEAKAVRKGRQDFIAQFPNLRDDELLKQSADPCAADTVEKVKLDWQQWDQNSQIVSLHRDLLMMRRSEPAFSQQACAREARLDGSVLSPSALLLRYFTEEASDERILLLNFGSDLVVDSLPDPLFAPPSGHQWQLHWSSEDPRYGGSGRRSYDFQKRWVLSGEVALVLEAVNSRPHSNASGRPIIDWQAEILRT